MVHFVTKKGLGLLFHPGPLDKWIGREVHYEEETERFWETPGEYFNDEMTKSYTAYRGRLQKRRALGRAADKLVKITDKYLPKVTDETRVYVMRFPHKIPILLKQARRVRKKAKGHATRGEASRPRRKDRQRNRWAAANLLQAAQPHRTTPTRKKAGGN